VAQLAGQLAAPSQMYVVLHTVPEVNVEHVPLVAAPAATEHAWHVPLHAVVQHTLLKQPAFVVSHSRQPLTLQSLDAHACPLALRAVHAPLLAQ
jgi:hypothetical protein